MNNKLFYTLLLFTVAFSSCKRQYARVQPAKLENFGAVKAAVANDNFDVQPLNGTTMTTSSSESFSEGADIDDLPIVRFPAEEKAVALKKQDIVPLNLAVTNRTAPLESNISTTEADVDKHSETTQKRKKLFNRRNTLIPSGLVLLAVAVLLSLVKLNFLAFLFGAASILFLYMGVRKMIRKNNRRKIFKR